MAKSSRFRNRKPRRRGFRRNRRPAENGRRLRPGLRIRRIGAGSLSTAALASQPCDGEPLSQEEQI